jgi:hypothetical protein
MYENIIEILARPYGSHVAFQSISRDCTSILRSIYRVQSVALYEQYEVVHVDIYTAVLLGVRCRSDPRPRTAIRT